MKVKLPAKDIIVKIYRLQSRSEPGIYYTIEVAKDGSLHCDCIAGTINRPCWHKIKVKEKIKETII